MVNNIKKKIRIDYYRVTSTSVEEKDLSNATWCGFDLAQWFALFDSEYKNLEQRIKPYNGENMRLEYISYNENTNLWELSFVRLRSNNLPKMAYDNKVSENIYLSEDEYIGEDVCMLYDPKRSVVILQRNRNSLSVNGIIRYINQTWNHRKNQVVDLEPIAMPGDWSKKRNGVTRKLHVRYSLPQTEVSSSNDQSMGSLIKNCQEYGATVVDVIVSVGRSKRRRLRNDRVFDTVDDFINDPNCQSMDIVYKEDESSPVEIIDLLSNVIYDQILIDVIPKQSISYTDIIDAMTQKYFEQNHIF